MACEEKGILFAISYFSFMPDQRFSASILIELWTNKVFGKKIIWLWRIKRHPLCHFLFSFMPDAEFSASYLIELWTLGIREKRNNMAVGYKGILFFCHFLFSFMPEQSSQHLNLMELWTLGIRKEKINGCEDKRHPLCHFLFFFHAWTEVSAIFYFCLVKGFLGPSFVMASGGVRIGKLRPCVFVRAVRHYRSIFLISHVPVLTMGFNGDWPFLL